MLCHYAECHVLFIVMLHVIMLNVVVLVGSSLAQKYWTRVELAGVDDFGGKVQKIF